MKKMKSVLMFTTILSVCLTVCLSDAANAKTIWLEEDDFRTPAQGDGDYEPTNVNVVGEEVSLQTGKKSVSMTVKAQDSLPTVTAEGSFLLPTYVLPEARTAKPVSVTSVDEKNPWRQTEKMTTTHTRRTFVKGSSTLPQQQVQPIAVQNTNNAKEAQLLATIEKQYQETSALLETTSKRLSALETGIENLSQQHAATRKTIEDNSGCNNASAAVAAAATTTVAPAPVIVDNGPSCCDVAPAPVAYDNRDSCCNSAPQEEVRKEPLLLPLAAARSVPVSIDDELDKDAQEVEITSVTTSRVEYVDYILGVIKRAEGRETQYSESDELILRAIPKEMKISFLPNVADLSDQAYKWIKVFAFNPKHSGESAVEIRMSGNDIDLQSRRFALIKGVLLSSGVSPRQVRFVFTDRDPDTIVLRSIKLQDDVEYVTKTQKNGKTSQQIIQKW